ncbi:MAG: hypothetical protein R2705_08525 [Ilumatobacteraceae bacterium]
MRVQDLDTLTAELDEVDGGATSPNWSLARPGRRHGQAAGGQELLARRRSAL